jgi:protein sidekick
MYCAHTKRSVLNVVCCSTVKCTFTFCCRATELAPEQNYMFSVTAQTRLGWGKTANALVFTTNNRERPQPPSVPQISPSQVQSEQITFSWTPGRDGFSPLRCVGV